MDEAAIQQVQDTISEIRAQLRQARMRPGDPTVLNEAMATACEALEFLWNDSGFQEDLDTFAEQGGSRQRESLNFS